MSRQTTSDSERAGGGEDGGRSRRTFLKATAATATIASISATADAQAQTYRFGGEVQGWRGRSPEAISGTTNPTLQLEAGTQYEVVWENLDGAPHDFTIQDANGNTLASTETMSSQGETRSLTFTASPEMAQYICTIHPTTMVGDVEVAGGDGQGEEEGRTLPVGFVLIGGAVLMALLSPIAFAVILLLVYDRETESPSVERT